MVGLPYRVRWLPGCWLERMDVWLVEHECAVDHMVRLLRFYHRVKRHHDEHQWHSSRKHELRFPG